LLDFDMSEGAQRNAPFIVDAAVASAPSDSPDALAELPLMLTTDPAILWDIDAVLGSYICCPGQPPTYRLVAPAKGE